MVDLLSTLLDNLNYWYIILLMAIESSFIPFPSEVVVPPAAYKAAGGEMNVVLVVVASTVGALIGSLVNYALAYFIGRPIIYRFANSRLGHMLLLSEEKIETAEKYFDRHGAASTFFGRLIPAVRQLISIPAGLARMNMAKFLLYTTLGAGIWNTVLAAIGYYLHSVVSEDELAAKVSEYSHELNMAILVAAVIVLSYIIYKGVRKK